MKTKFKVLKYGNIFVDSNYLTEGIYATSKPLLYSENDSIEDLIKYFQINYSDNDYFKKYLKNIIENLSKCKLVEVELTEL